MSEQFDQHIAAHVNGQAGGNQAGSNKVGGNIETWPPDVQLLLSALEETGPLGKEHRLLPRRQYRVRAALELMSAAQTQLKSNPKSNIVPVYTRDANAWALGWISALEVPVGMNARVHLPSASDRIWCIDCTVLRCHEIIDGWFEGAVYFEKEQVALIPAYDGQTGA